MHVGPATIDGTHGITLEHHIDEGRHVPASGEAGCGLADRTRYPAHVASMNRS